MTDAANIQIRINTSDAERADRIIDALIGKSDRLHTSLGSLNTGTSFDKLRTAANDTNGSFNKVSDSATKATGSIDKVKQSASGVAIGFRTVAAAASAIGFGKVIQTGREFQASMNDVQEKLNLTGEAMVEVRDFALEMGETTAFSASEAANALSDLAALGFDAADSMGVLPDVLDLAASSGLELEDAARKTATTLNQFGLEVDQSTRVVDLLAGTADSSAANVGFLTEVFSKAGPVATELGVSMEEVAAAAAILADKGVRAETTGTALRNVFDQLINPSDAVAESMAKVGLSAADFAVQGEDGKRQFIGLGAAFDILNDSGADTPQLMEILGREIGAMIPAIRGGSAAMEEIAERTEAAASAAEQAITKQQGLPGAFRLVASAWEAVQLAFLDQGPGQVVERFLLSLAQILRDTAGFLRDTGDAWRDFVGGLSSIGSASLQTVQRMDGLYGVVNRIINVFDSVADTIRPALPYLRDFGIAFVSVAATAGGLLAVKAALVAIGTTLAAISGVGLAISAVAAGAVLIQRNWGSIAAWWAGLWDGLDGDVVAFTGRFFRSIGDMATNLISAGVDMAADFVGQLSSTISNSVGSINWPTVTQITTGAATMIRGFGELAGRLVSGLVTGLSNSLASIGADVRWPTAARVISGAADILAGFATLGLQLTVSLVQGITDGLRGLGAQIEWPTASEIGQRAGSMLRAFADLALLALSEFRGSFSDNVSSIFDSIRWPTGAQIISGTSSLVAGFVDLARGVYDGFTGNLSDSLSNFHNDIEWPSNADIRQGAVRLLSGFASLANDLMSGMAEQIRNYDFSNLGSIIGNGLARVAVGLISYGVDLAKGLGQGVTQGTQDYFRENSFVDLLGSILGGAIDIVAGFVTGFGNAFASEFRRLDLTEGFVDAFENLTVYLLRLPFQMTEIAGDIVNGLIEGIGQAGRDRLASAAESLANLIPDWIRRTLGIASPSTVMIEIGGYIIDGLIEGIEQNISTMLDVVVDFFSDFGGEVTESMENAFSGALDYLESLPGTISLYAADMVAGLLSGFADFGNSITVAIVEGFSGAFDYLRALPANMVSIGLDIIDGLVEGIVGTGREKIRAAVDSVAGIIPQGVRDFLDIQSPSRVMKQIGVFVSQGLAEGIRAGTTDVQDSVTGISRLVAEAGNAIAENIARSIGSGSGLREGIASLGDFMQTWLQEQIAYFAANKITAFITGGVGDIGELFSGAGGDGGIGSIFSGIFGGAADSTDDLAASINDLESQSLGATTKVVSFGSALGAVGLVAAAGQVVIDTFGSAYDGLSDTLREIHSVRSFIDQFASEAPGILQDATDLMRDLGIDVSQELTDAIGSEMAVAASNTALTVAERWEAVNRVAYAEAFNNLGPNLRSMVENVFEFDIETASIEEIQQIFADISEISSQMIPALNDVGLAMGTTTDESIAFAVGLADSMGGAGTAMEALTLFADEFVPVIEDAGDALETNARSLAEWNANVGDTQHLEAANAGLASFRSQVADHYEQMYGSEAIGYIDLTAAAMLNQQSALNDYTFSLDTSTEAGVLAAQQVEAFTTRIDTATGQLEVNDAALFNYIGSLDTSTQAGQAAYESALKLADSLGVTAESTIDTREEMYNYVQALEDQYQAGQLTTQQYTDLTAAALEQLPAIIAIEDAYIAQLETLGTVTEAAKLLNLNFDETAPSALQASDALVELFGGLDEFETATTNFYNSYYDAKDLEQQALTDSLIAVENFNSGLVASGDSAITSADQFKTYVQGLEVGTEAGDAAFMTALNVADAFLAVNDAGLQQVERLDAVAEAANLLNLNFDPLAPSALAFSDTLVELLGGMDGFAAATSNYYNRFFDEKEREQIALTNSAIAVQNYNNDLEASGLEAITSAEGFREHVEALQLGGVATADALAEALLMSEAMFEVTEAGGDVNAIMNEMPENLRTNFETMTTMTDDMSGTFGELSQAGFDTEAILATLPEDMRDHFNTMTTISDEGATGIIGSFRDIFDNATGASEDVKTEYQSIGQGIQSVTGQISTTIKDSNSGQLDSARNTASMLNQIASATSTQRIQNATNEANAISRVYFGSGNKIIQSVSNQTNTIDRLFSLSAIRNIQTAQNVASQSNNAQSQISLAANSFTRVASSGSNAHSSINTLSGRVYSLGSSASSVSGTLGGVVRSLSSAVNTASGLRGKLSNAFINGSFMTGLDYVPFDGFIAELHKGERVLTKEENERFSRDADFRPVNNVVVNSASTPPASNDSSHVANELARIRQELSEIKAENRTAAGTNERLLGSVGSETGRQTRVMEESNRVGNRNHRRTRLG